MRWKKSYNDLACLVLDYCLFIQQNMVVVRTCRRYIGANFQNLYTTFRPVFFRLRFNAVEKVTVGLIAHLLPYARNVLIVNILTTFPLNRAASETHIQQLVIVHQPTV